MSKKLLKNKSQNVPQVRKYGIKDRTIARALIKAYGNVTVASKILGTSRRNLNRRIAANEFLQRIKIDSGQQIFDLARHKWVEKIDTGDNYCIGLALKTFGKHEGFGVQENDAPIRVNQNNYTQINITNDKLDEIKPEYEQNAKRLLGILEDVQESEDGEVQADKAS